MNTGLYIWRNGQLVEVDQADFNAYRDGYNTGISELRYLVRR